MTKVLSVAELCQCADKWASTLIRRKYGDAVAAQARRGLNGLVLTPEAQAYIALVNAAATKVKAQIPADERLRRTFSPAKQPDWPA